MKLEKHRYEDVVILRFTGEFDTFNLPTFSERIDRMAAAGDDHFILDLKLLRFINSAALGYLIKMSKRAKAGGGEVLIARPSKFVKKTLTTLGLDSVFKVFDSVESAMLHFKKGLDIGQLNLEGGEEDDALKGETPILFRPIGEKGDELPNQVGRIVTLREDGLLFRCDVSADGSDPISNFLQSGTQIKMKFRQPFAVKDYYFEMTGEVIDVTRADEESNHVLTARVSYGDMKSSDREHLDEFVKNHKEWKSELG